MSNYKFETLQLHVGQETADPATDARAVPIYATTSYVFHDCAHAAARFGLTDAGNIYGRLTNSTQDVFEKRIAALEGGVAALAVSSGAAAISYVLQALGQNGGHFVAQKTIYGGSYNLLEHTLPNFGITASFVNIHDLAEVEGAIQEDTRAIYIETLGNPNSDIPDIDALAELAHKHGLPLVVDNTSPTMTLYRDLTYSKSGGKPSTKYLPTEIPVSVNNHNMTAEIEDMCTVILNDTAIECDVIQGANTVALCQAAVKSAATGKPCVPEYFAW